MIYVTGDTHGDMLARFTPASMPGEDTWGPGDKLIGLGDFGLIFYPETELFLDKLALEEQKKAFLEQKPYEILFIDGNHENFDRLAAYPEETRWGGPVRRIGRNIFWLQRGRIYTIEDRTFFCMGGAYSLDKPGRLAKEREFFLYYPDQPELRLLWWPQELPDDAQYKTAERSLVANGRKVDYVLSHTCPTSLIYEMRRVPDMHDGELTGFLDWIWHEIGFEHWYFGHWHIDETVHPRATALYFGVVRVGGDGGIRLSAGEEEKDENGDL